MPLSPIILTNITLLFSLVPNGGLVALAGVLLPPVLFLESRRDFESVAAELTGKGVRALAPAHITGKSGVKHEFAFAVVPDSGRPKVVVDSELSIKEVDEMKVLKFYVKVFDVSPEKAILCVSPGLTERASALAKEYEIGVLEDDVPRNLVSKASEMVGGMLGKNGRW